MSPQVQGLVKARDNKEPQKVFVYGTLKKGFHNHHPYLGDARDLGIASVEGMLFHLGGCPALSLVEKFCNVSGEVYETDWDHIDHLDRLEGVPTFYQRIETIVSPHGRVWTYIYPKNNAEKESYIIPSGLWRGQNTPKVKWGGFGKGVEVGTFEADNTRNLIRIAEGESPYLLIRQGLDREYTLIHKQTGEIFGRYKHLRDDLGSDGRMRPVLRLRPDVVRQNPPTPPNAVRETVEAAINGGSVSLLPGPSTVPTVITSDPKKVEPEPAPIQKIPQAVRLLGIKYGEA